MSKQTDSGTLPQAGKLANLAHAALDDLKAVDIVSIDIREKSSIADVMIICTGTSRRHVLSLADSVRLKAKNAGQPPLGVEGEDSADWVLVDLGDVIVHVMTADTRDFYSLEKLWSVSPSASADSQADTDTPAGGDSAGAGIG